MRQYPRATLLSHCSESTRNKLVLISGYIFYFKAEVDVRVARILCFSGRELVRKMIEDYSVDTSVIFYFCIESDLIKWTIHLLIHRIGKCYSVYIMIIK